MLDSETKRRIDTARDILVGKVPDPKSQVEQITIALIYKFMDDMDKESMDFGGEASFFTGEYEKYSWTKIFDPKIGGHEMLNLYGEAIIKLNLNPNIPQLFRDIFKNAYLPYRDPETLKLFLKTINEFRYDHSEMLGDAFEYLLSVLGSQGDAGQFRTPRHIIDFIVQALEPKKGESICDPACGTAGFLISAYKHILASNARPSPAGEGLGVRLTPDDRKKLMQNFTGYDISPDMVRLSLVNMYLHGFTTPKIYEYDTLTSEDRWHEYFDVILANPPFMSPKGGIKPHKKFTVQANRSEVLFVDYIAEHIHPSTGRAGIIVPEGIIFQSAGAYRQLRKMLVKKEYLYAVVSLPAGIFQPYSGVKTSILLLDKTLARKTNNILFVKIDNDGFDLGAQRRAIDKNDLTGCLPLLQQYKQDLQSGKPFVSDNKNVFLVDKETIAAKDDFNLSIDRYRVSENMKQSKFEMMRLGEVCELEYGKPLKEENRTTGDFPVFGSNGIVGYHNEYLVEAPFIIVGRKGSAGSVHLSEKNGFPIDTTFFIKLKSENKVLLKFLYKCLIVLDLKKVNTQAGVPGLNRNDAYDLLIPLPPLSVQQEIVAKIENYQAIINGAKQVIENYKPQIDINPDWEMVELGEVCEKITKGSSPNWQGVEYVNNNGILFITSENVGTRELLISKKKYVEERFNSIEKKSILKFGDVLTNIVGASIGRTAIFYLDEVANINQAVCILRCIEKSLNNYFLMHLLNSDYFLNILQENKVDNARANLSLGFFEKLQIPLPPLSGQQQIVRRIEEEQALVNGNKKLILIYEQKIKDEINRLWER